MALVIQIVVLIPEQVGILVLHIVGQIQIGHLLLLQVAMSELLGKLQPLQRAADELAF